MLENLLFFYREQWLLLVCVPYRARVGNVSGFFISNEKTSRHLVPKTRKTIDKHSGEARQGYEQPKRLHRQREQQKRH
jgi:hypothetical protein